VNQGASSTWDQRGRRALFAVGSVAVLAAVMGLWGTYLNARGAEMLLKAPPFFGRWKVVERPLALVPAAFVGIIIGRWWPSLTRRLRWRWVLVGSWAASFAWSFTLTVSRGWDQLWLPLDKPRFEYLPLARELGGVDEVRTFVRTFVERLPEYPDHVRGHGPLPVIGFWLLDQVGLGNPGIGIFVIAVGATAGVGALIAFDRIAGRDLARRAAVFVGLGPAVIWFSSGDAIFMALVAWSTAAVAVAVTSASVSRGRVAGTLGGFGCGLLLLCTYGAPPLLAPLAAVALWGWWRGKRSWVLGAAIGGAAPLLAFQWGGFSWWDGFAATRLEYWKGIASRRPYRYFLISNLVVVAIAAGPASVAGLTLLRRRAVWLLVAGAVAGALMASISGYSKAEVERIWLPLTPFLAIAAAALPDGPIPTRVWLAGQLLLTWILQATLFAPW